LENGDGADCETEAITADSDDLWICHDVCRIINTNHSKSLNHLNQRLIIFTDAAATHYFSQAIIVNPKIILISG
jgi:hypothetical protein